MKYRTAIGSVPATFVGCVFTSRRVSEGRKREDVASDVTPSLAYASGWDGDP